MSNGNEHQITCAATKPKAIQRSNVHEKPVLPSTSLTRPKFASNRNSQIVEPATAGVAHAPSAARNSSIRAQGRTLVASTASAAPTTRVPMTQVAAKPTVCQSTVQNCWSPNSFV